MGEEELVKALQDFCMENDMEYCGDYSGRFMYGARCPGIIMQGNPLNAVMCLCDYLRDRDAGCVGELLGSICSDSMGMGSIIYFPQIAL